MKIINYLLLFLVLSSCAPKQPTVFQWRGEERKGIFHESNLLKEWPENGPKEIWTLEEIGDGYGTPTITSNEIFVTGAIDSTATLFCISLEGKINWQVSLGKEWVTNFPGSRSQPTVVDDLIYVGTGMGNLYCLKRANGELVWKKDFVNDFAGIYPRFGHSEAPLVHSNKVFWTPGGKEANVVAIDRFTGEIIWKNKGFGERSGYNPGTLISLPTRNIFVTFSAYHIMGFDTETGELLWSQEQDNIPVEKRKPGAGDTHGNCIIFDNGYIYYAAGDGLGGVKLQLSEDGSEIKQVWRNAGFDSYMGGIVKIDSHIYGSGTSTKYLKSINAETGELSDSLKLGWGAIIAADNMLYYYGQNGKLSLINYNQGKMNQVSQFKIQKGTKEHFSHPIIDNGILYQRRGKALMAFDIKAN